MKTITNSDIENAFNELIKVNDETSNLEVKEHLRTSDFWVSQQEVKDYIDVNYQLIGLQRSRNTSGYFVYTKETGDTLSKRQLDFCKDSTDQLISKMSNPKYAQYMPEIQTIIEERGIQLD